MQSAIIHKRLFKIALITSPLFGLFGAFPGLGMHEVAIEKVLIFFVYTTSFTFFLWLINILLVKLFTKNEFQYNNIARYLISAAICIGVLILLFWIFPPQMMRPHIVANGAKEIQPLVHDNRMHFKPRLPLMQILQGLSVNTIITVLIELIILKQTKLKVDSEIEQLKLSNLEARNSQLKQQLHPHFLFNSLSTLRSLIRRSPDKAEEYLEQLSELLRFSTNNSNQSLVTLKEEIELCTNYLAMQQTRFGDALQFDITIDEVAQEKGKVPVFALQQLAENAIKHNILTKEEPLFIKIFTDESRQWVVIKNNLQPKQSIEYSSGVGLANLSERYKLTGAEDIIIKNDGGSFSVAIKIIDYAGNNN